MSHIAEDFEACRGLRGMRVRRLGGGGCMVPWQIGCDPLGVRVHSEDTGEDVSFEGDLSWPPGGTYLAFLSCPPLCL